jgi:hypothetical protein
MRLLKCSYGEYELRKICINALIMQIQTKYVDYSFFA